MPKGICLRKKTGKYKNCLVCNNKFYIRPSHILKGEVNLYCSRKCRVSHYKHSKGTIEKIRKSHLGNPLSIEHRKQLSLYHTNVQGKNNPMYGKKHSQEAKLKISFFMKTRPPTKGCFKKGYRPITKGRRKYNLKDKRAKHIFYPEYVNWRNQVFKRDNFSCQKCDKKNVYLEAHHIKVWAKYPELRFNINNGITFCKNCHKKIHRKKCSLKFCHRKHYAKEYCRKHYRRFFEYLKKIHKIKAQASQ